MRRRTPKAGSTSPLPGLSLPPCVSPAGICSNLMAKMVYFNCVQPPVSDRGGETLHKVFPVPRNTLFISENAMQILYCSKKKSLNGTINLQMHWKNEANETVGSTIL